MDNPRSFDNIRDNVKLKDTSFYVSLSAATGTQAGCITLTGLPYFRCQGMNYLIPTETILSLPLNSLCNAIRGDNRHRGTYYIVFVLSNLIVYYSKRVLEAISIIFHFCELRYGLRLFFSVFHYKAL